MLEQKEDREEAIKRLITNKKDPKTWLIVDSETINDIRVLVESTEIVPNQEMKDLKTKRPKTSMENIILAELFIKGYDHLLNNISRFYGGTEEEKYGDKVKEYLDQFNIKALREIMRSYGFGNNFGDQYRESEIEEIVQENREKMVELVNLFFQIFSEDI